MNKDTYKNKIQKKYFEKIEHDFKNKHKKDNIEYRLKKIKLLTKKSKLFSPIINFNKDVTNFNLNFSNEKDINNIYKKHNKLLYDVLKNLSGKVKFVKSGSTGIVLKLSLSCGAVYAVKIISYLKDVSYYGDINNTKRPENTELLMLKLLSNIVINRISPHIILPVTTFNIEMKDFL